MDSKRDSNNVSRPTSMYTTRPQHDDDCWSVCSADEVYPTHPKRKLPIEELSEMVTRSQLVLSNLAKDTDGPLPIASPDVDPAYDSDYGPPGGSIGRMPSRRFGSRRSRRKHLPQLPLQEIRPLSIRQRGPAASSMANAAPLGKLARKPSATNAEIPTTVESFEDALARMSETPIPPPPRKTPPKTVTAVSSLSRSNTFDYYNSINSTPSSTTIPNTTTYSSNKRSRASSKTYSPGRSLSRKTSISHGLNEKCQGLGVGAEMVEIPIADDDVPEKQNPRSRGLSVNSMDSENALPPYAGPVYAAAVPHGYLGLSGAPSHDMTHDKATEKEGSVLHTVRATVIVLALALAVFVVGMNINIITTATSHIAKDFNSPTNSSWYSTSYLMALCVCQLSFGRFYILFSAQWVFAIALFIFELGSLIAAVSPASSVFIIGRAVQGVGAAGILSGALVIGTLTVPLRKRSMVSGIIGSAAAMAMVSAPMLGANFAENVHWKWAFYINMPTCTIILVVILFCLRIPKSAGERDGNSQTFSQRLFKLDLSSTAILIPFIVCLLLLLRWGGKEYEWKSPAIIVLFVATPVFLAIFCYLQHRKQNDALVPPSIFKKRTLLAGVWFTFTISAATFVIAHFVCLASSLLENDVDEPRTNTITLNSQVPIWSQLILTHTPATASTQLWSMLVGTSAGATFAVVLVTVVGYYTPFMILGTVLMSIGAGLLSTLTATSTDRTSDALLLIFPALFGAGCGVAFQQPMVAVQAALEDSDLPIAFSLLAFAQSIGAAAVLPIAKTVFVDRLVTNIRDETGLSVSTGNALKFGNIKKAVLEASGSLANLIQAYNKSITQVFLVAVVMAALSIVGAMATEWRNIRREVDRKRHDAELSTSAINEKYKQQQHYQSNHPNPYLTRQNQASMAYNIIDNSNQISPMNYLQQQQAHYFELDSSARAIQPYDHDVDATRPQPYDQAGSKRGSPYNRSQQFSMATAVPDPYYRGPVGGSGPYNPSPYEMQRTQGLGFNGGFNKS